MIVPFVRKTSCPPGRSTRAASATHRYGSAQRPAPYSEIARSKLASANGRRSALPSKSGKERPYCSWSRARSCPCRRGRPEARGDRPQECSRCPSSALYSPRPVRPARRTRSPTHSTPPGCGPRGRPPRRGYAPLRRTGRSPFRSRRLPRRSRRLDRRSPGCGCRARLHRPRSPAERGAGTRAAGVTPVAAEIRRRAVPRASRRRAWRCLAPRLAARRGTGACACARTRPDRRATASSA